MIKWIPNILSLSRLPIGYIITLQALLGNWTIAFVLLTVGLFTDWFDGYLAIKLDAKSHLGEILEGPCDLALTLGVLSGLVFTNSLSWFSIGVMALILIIIWTPIILFAPSRLSRVCEGLAPLYYLLVILTLTVIYAFKAFGYLAFWLVGIIVLPLAFAVYKFKSHRLNYWFGLISGKNR